MLLPKYFMVYTSHGYKFYKNTIRFPPNNSYNPVNVAIPLMNATIRMISKYTRDQNTFEGILSRETLARMYSFKCKFTGYEATINLDHSRIIVPAVYFSDCEQTILPKGSPILTPPTNIVHWSYEANAYLEADIVAENETFIPVAPVATAPVATAPVATAPVAALVSTSRISLYPAHIKQLIIADCIQKNEYCAITGDLISQENACITTCGHVFTRSGLTGWFTSSSGSICPICRQHCEI